MSVRVPTPEDYRTECVAMGLHVKGEHLRGCPNLHAPTELEQGLNPDMVAHPPHYRHPSGVECITVTEHMTFLRGNAVKYLWRAGAKGGPTQELEDLKKARWYLDREIGNLERQQGAQPEEA